MADYGRNRNSINDIEEQLNDIFYQYSTNPQDDNGPPMIRVDKLPDVLREISEFHGGPILTDNEMDGLHTLISRDPNQGVTPELVLGLIASRTKQNQERGSGSEGEDDNVDRGRGSDRDNSAIETQSRSSSRSSTGTPVHGSRPPSRGLPQTPTSAKGQSVFDTSRRQRALPLSNNAPSSWTKTRPGPVRRRNSDAGSRSDSEQSSSVGSFGRAAGRSRAPSNPTSPSSQTVPLGSIFSPPTPSHTPSHTRTMTQPQAQFNDAGYHYGSDEQEREEDNPLYDFKSRRDNKAFLKSVSTVRLSRNRPGENSDSGSDREDSNLGLVMDRTVTSSTVSMEPNERLEALQRITTELKKKLTDAELTLSRKITENELDLEEVQGRLDETRSELSACKREEKELRSKERQNMTQIGALEIEIAKVTKALEHARSTYTSLQRQYQEQCAVSEKYREDLRQREETIRNLRDAASLHDLENAKWAKEHENYEERIAQIEAELSLAQQAHSQLDEQKQENMLLKETIDRMRFDMDEMRNNASAFGANSGHSSSSNTISKSLGAELAGKMKGTWGLEENIPEDEPDDASEGSTVVEVEESDSTEGEDVIQTIITRKKRKVGSRANKIETRIFEETKEYSDAYTQHELSDFTASSTTQTDPEPKILTSSFSVQTDDLDLDDSAIQTDPEPVPVPRVTLDMEVQTEEIEDTLSRSPSPTAQDDEAMASSSSTVIPPTPKATATDLPQLHPSDQPPAYNQINEREQEERDFRVAAETLRKWHNGAKIPFEPIAGGISEDAVEEWKALKAELGIECMVIDKIVATSDKTGQPRPHKSASRRGRFYNIYNTYVYGDGKAGGSSSFPSGAASQVVLWIGASALLCLAISPYMVVPYYSVPGGPTYSDRLAWSTFNSMQATGEGFSPDGTAAVWSFLGRVGGGAARIARGWPT